MRCRDDDDDNAFIGHTLLHSFKYILAPVVGGTRARIISRNASDKSLWWCVQCMRLCGFRCISTRICACKVLGSHESFAAASHPAHIRLHIIGNQFAHNWSPISLSCCRRRRRLGPNNNSLAHNSRMQPTSTRSRGGGRMMSPKRTVCVYVYSISNLSICLMRISTVWIFLIGIIR